MEHFDKPIVARLVTVCTQWQRYAAINTNTMRKDECRPICCIAFIVLR